MQRCLNFYTRAVQWTILRLGIAHTVVQNTRQEVSDVSLNSYVAHDTKKYWRVCSADGKKLRHNMTLEFVAQLSEMIILAIWQFNKMISVT